MKVPQWAQDLLLDACIYLGMEEVPDLTWRHRRDGNSSGLCHIFEGENPPRIVVSACKGRDARFHDKLVLLHELAHAYTKDLHTEMFWDTAWDLYRWAKLPTRKVLEREGNYKKGAVVAYKRSRRVQR